MTVPDSLPPGALPAIGVLAGVVVSQLFAQHMQKEQRKHDERQRQQQWEREDHQRHLSKRETAYSDFLEAVDNSALGTQDRKPGELTVAIFRMLATSQRIAIFGSQHASIRASTLVSMLMASAGRTSLTPDETHQVALARSEMIEAIRRDLRVPED